MHLEGTLQPAGLPSLTIYSGIPGKVRVPKDVDVRPQPL